MTNGKSYQALTQDQIRTLTVQGCTADNWNNIRVAPQFNPSCVRNVQLHGTVSIGNLTGNIIGLSGLRKPCGIYNATIINCTIGDLARIANVSLHIANYDIADGVCIENVDTMQTGPDATFGNGIEMAVLNEAGGREIILFDQLNAQFAYLMCLHRYRPRLIQKLKTIANDYVKSIRSTRGKIGATAHICSVSQIIDVNIGSHAVVNGATTLTNGTILSSIDSPTIVGVEVIAENFIIAEGSSVTDGALLDKVFVGQGCQIGKQFSAQNSVFFANSEAFHGEACSVFAGPYTVTHHKSSLLIAGLFSFYNAGSGTNQSNHMYKLGPLHEGKLLRGTKTGSFSYVMWPCRTGPFSVVLGKHTSIFDTSDFPFSHLEARADGKCSMVPGLHLTTVGTIRDGAKWPKRDRRRGTVKRDIISFDVFSPYTVGKMLKANERLKYIQQATDKSIQEVSLGGAIVKRPMLHTSQKFYNMGIIVYLLEKVIEKAEKILDDPAISLPALFATDPDAVHSPDWLDIAGQLMPRQRLLELEEAIENGSISTIQAFTTQIEKINRAYCSDEWIWVSQTYKKVFNGTDLTSITKDKLIEIAQELLKVKTKFLNLVIADAQKEFSELSRCGFGQDGTEEDVETDFCQTKGLYEENRFVKDLKANLETLQQRVRRFEQILSDS